MIRPIPRSTYWCVITALALTISGCSDPDPIATERYDQPDSLFMLLENNVIASEELETIMVIDHSRLGADAGSVMPPAKVLMFSNPRLESELVSINPLVGIDLPLRILAYESVADRSGKITFNSFQYLESRYALGDVAELESMFDASMTDVLHGIDRNQVTAFEDDTMQPDGIVTLTSPYDFETTLHRLTAAIGSQDDTVWFGRVDFQSRAKALGMEIAPALLLLFGGPAPGAKAMAEAPTLGLDAFCQKLLLWQDSAGAVQVSYNDLLKVAERQNVQKNVALRVINYRINSLFSNALE